MLLVKLFLVISLLHFIAAGDVTCDGKYSTFRTRYRKILEIGGNVFMGVSYSLATDENSTEKTTILKKIEKERSHIFMPITFATEGESAYINVVLDGGDQKQLHQAGFDYVKHYLSRNLGFLGLGKVYIYLAKTTRTTQPETIVFHACRVSLDSNHEIEVEKSVLMIVSGRVLSETEIIERNKANPLKVTVFKFPEFKDRDYDICEHLDFYLNECVERKPKMWVVYIEIVVCVTVGVVAAIFFLKFSCNSSTQTVQNQTDMNQMELNQIEANRIEPNQAETSATTVNCQQVKLNQIPPVMRQITVSQLG
jgi:hypothetical protein